MAGDRTLDWVLWAAVVVAMVWAHLPLVMVTLRLRLFRVERIDDPASVAPRPGDTAYQALHDQILRLGFTPLGATIESGWFLTPRRWYWRSLEGVRVFASRERMTFFTVHRLLAGEPPRFGAVTLFEGGGYLRTTCPGAGLPRDLGPRYRRIELQQVDAAELLARHDSSLAEFCRQSGFTPRPATLADLQREDRNYSDLSARRRPVAPEWVHTLSSYVLAPAAGLALPGNDHGRRFAFTLLAGAVIHLTRLRFFFTHVRPKVVLATHNPRPPAS